MTKPVKVTLNDAPTPSEQLINKARAEVLVTDAQGRRLLLKKPGVLAQFRLIEALGPETSKNHTYTAMVMPLIYLASIDDDPIYPPANKREIEALIQRLDEDGLAAVAEGIAKNFGERSPEADKEALKNS